MLWTGRSCPLQGDLISQSTTQVSFTSALARPCCGTIARPPVSYLLSMSAEPSEGWIFRRTIIFLRWLTRARKERRIEFSSLISPQAYPTRFLSHAHLVKSERTQLHGLRMEAFL